MHDKTLGAEVAGVGGIQLEIIHQSAPTDVYSKGYGIDSVGQGEILFLAPSLIS